MSKRILTINLKELTTLRIVCKKCGGIAEIALKEIDSAYFMRSGSVCKFCKAAWVPEVDGKENYNALVELQTAIQIINHLSQSFTVEFPVAEED